MGVKLGLSLKHRVTQVYKEYYCNGLKDTGICISTT